MVTLWHLQSNYPARVFTLAPTYRQVKLNLWGDIRKFYAGSIWPIGGELLQTELKLSSDLFAVGFSTNEPDRVHGIHGANDLLILDELQGFKREMIEAVENALAGGNAKVLALCNPNVLNGEAYDAFHSKRELYNCISISAFDTPNVKEGRVIIPGMITLEQANEWIKTYGRNSNFCRVKVFAEFPKQEADTLIPLDWVEQAIVREVEPAPRLSLGVDVARFGPDRSVLFPMAGRQAYKPTILEGNDTMRVAGRVASVLKDNLGSRAHIDVIGIGSGVVDRCAEQELSVTGVNVAEKARNPEKFNNLRSELWYNAREALNPENPNAIALPPDCPGLIAELSSVKYKVDSSGRIRVESKEDMKKRLGYSPDIADGFCLALDAVACMDATTLKAPEPTRRSGLALDEERASFDGGNDSFLSGLIE